MLMVSPKNSHEISRSLFQGYHVEMKRAGFCLFVIISFIFRFWVGSCTKDMLDEPISLACTLVSCSEKQCGTAISIAVTQVMTMSEHMFLDETVWHVV